jgi:trimethylamine--corrinoid protein Co-methyltransferase
MIDTKNNTDGRRVRTTFLDGARCREIVQAACRVLERTGCVVQHEGALELLRKAGGKIDGNRIKIPVSLTESCIKTTPEKIMIYDRNGNPAVELGPATGKSTFAPGVANLFRVDSFTGERRTTTLKDIADTAVLVDHLPNIDFALGLATASDRTESLTDFYEVKTLIENTVKPFICGSFSKENFLLQEEMFAAVAGGREKFAEKPFAIGNAMSVPALLHTEESLDIFFEMVRFGIPVFYIGSPLMGGTAPMSPASTIMMGLADSFVGLVLSQLIKPGAPFIAASFPDILDMRSTQFTFSSPEFALASAALGDIMRYLNIPGIVHLGGTDSPVFDAQTAFDAGTQIFSSLLGGNSMTMFLGYLESANSSSLEALVFADEAIGYLRRIIGGFEVNAETLAEDLVEEKGPQGNYLDTDHTFEHVRDNWVPDVITRASYNAWSESGKKDLFARCNEKIKRFLSEGTGNPLDLKIREELDRIAEKAEKSRKK